MASFVEDPIINVLNEGGGAFFFRVFYTIRYTPEEMNFEFADSMALFEEDGGLSLGDDFLGNQDIRTFFPEAIEFTRRFEFRMFADDLGTEIDGEEIYAVVHHRRNIPTAVSATRRSAVFPIAV
ncbi:hypothetical protein [Streptomyces sp. NRRL F-2580]|uniref:hypothetical protein n=1 Tax=Streptomyces sp. NRRL F-2580 TaxID=1463841 RepID=UPI0004CBD294|nr:hypothetical protein [Streptomyces sp. NRRL F-2580]